MAEQQNEDEACLMPKTHRVDMAREIKKIIQNLTDSIGVELSSFFTPYHNSDTNIIITGFSANAVLALCMSNHSLYYTYKELLTLTGRSYKFVNGKLIADKLNVIEIDQVENDKADYNDFLWSYNRAWDGLAGSRKDCVFDDIAKLLLKKLDLKLKEGFSEKQISLFLEKEYLRAENELCRRMRGSFQFFWENNKNVVLFSLFVLFGLLFEIGRVSFSYFYLSTFGIILFVLLTLCAFFCGKLLLSETTFSSLFIALASAVAFIALLTVMIGFIVLSTTIMGDTSDVIDMLLHLKGQ